MRKYVSIGASALLVLAAACGGSSGEVTDLTDDAAMPAEQEASAEPEVQEEEVAPASIADGDTVEIVMNEFAYEPSDLTVPMGATVTFRFVNGGQVEHEAVIGDIHMQEDHEAAMAAGMDQGAMEDQGAMDEMHDEETKTDEEAAGEEGHTHDGEHSDDHPHGDEANSDEKSEEKAAADEGGHDGMDAMHDHGSAALTLQANEDGSLEYTFEEAGTFMIGCHIPGHWDAGMQATITVV
jgi:uncharacterized cupredoxin-like copper-binding protein